jgi:WD40 repeat protein
VMTHRWTRATRVINHDANKLSDSTIYVWKKETGELIEKLAGHNGIVNCVHWNPVNPYMFASSGDDRTIRM